MKTVKNRLITERSLFHYFNYFRFFFIPLSYYYEFDSKEMQGKTLSAKIGLGSR
ncbi:hypothetical protein HMI01_09520 [Halolactibacillus miurensis]|uniref:Uncharacterized protein n=1 Tax=Halolactibacillus miurensis TaxID=306541 RepID=A0ABQ0VUY2_9BACI|nr:MULTISPECIES: hypothetical protein [Halolactibacillus]GEM03964.1 hypothetical protein HMI01_09520 [Halolactibacillus miurensis]